jgi:hypothetical protein
VHAVKQAREKRARSEEKRDLGDVPGAPVRDAAEWKAETALKPLPPMWGRGRGHFWGGVPKFATAVSNAGPSGTSQNCRLRFPCAGHGKLNLTFGRRYVNFVRRDHALVGVRLRCTPLEAVGVDFSKYHSLTGFQPFMHGIFTHSLSASLSKIVRTPTVIEVLSYLGLLKGQKQSHLEPKKRPNAKIPPPPPPRGPRGLERRV